MNITQIALKKHLQKQILKKTYRFYLKKKALLQRWNETYRILGKKNIIYLKIKKKRFNIFLSALDYRGGTLLMYSLKNVLKKQHKQIRKFHLQHSRVVDNFVKFFLEKLKQKEIKPKWIQNIFWNNSGQILNWKLQKYFRNTTVKSARRRIFQTKQNWPGTLLRQKKRKRK